MRPILIVPGYSNSGPEHWQTHLERAVPGARRVRMPSWHVPLRHEWIGALEEAVASAPQPPVLVAHSLGCMAVAHWAAETKQPVHGALLVAPCDVDRPELPPVLRRFGPAPLRKLEMPSLVAASSNDPYCSVQRAQDFAHGWGATLRILGPKGHVNVSSGHGPWPEAQLLLRELL
jgi:predicted alpha/beta hydrolase family esterase